MDLSNLERRFYSYLNLESTKTISYGSENAISFTVT